MVPNFADFFCNNINGLDDNDYDLMAESTGNPARLRMRIEDVEKSPSYLSQPEAAELLRLSPRTLERHRLSGTGPRFCRLGRRVVYRRADLDAWAEENAFRSTSEADAA